MSKKSNLLLEDEEPCCLRCYFFNNVVDIVNPIRVLFGFRVLLVYLGGQRTGTVNRSDSRDINNVIWLCAFTEFLCAFVCELKDANKVALVEDMLIDCFIFQVNDIRMQVLIVPGPNVIIGWIFNTFGSLEKVPNTGLNHFES